MKNFKNLEENELIEIKGGGLSEWGEVLWDAVGYTAKVWDICCQVAFRNGTLSDPQFHSK
ncbi:hypothetical protein A33Q_0714 [Indibacter alkaliphilus LW1]|jgi:hypothetical protein|uniref:Uncharacterized protein n=1 Tax=Indibacter alkaliphilus (strain CCUG 57479 / KCTC 22604 / LW1) TaxID=1189612 RepID=S2E447_INDAL|nr:hypothetical protein [Indibacter alkaliphilus]EOZ99336.1 hypothetical protein A33Q_0714 [Indibacter alkaliphilus LW1]